MSSIAWGTLELRVLEGLQVGDYFLVVCENWTVHTTTMQKELLWYRGSLLAAPGSNSIKIEGFGA